MVVEPQGSRQEGAAGGVSRRWLILFLVGFPLLWALWLGSYALLPGSDAVVDSATTVIVPRNCGLNGIRKVLAAEGVIRDDIRFTLLAGLMGMAGRLRAGEYSFAPGLSPYRVLTDLVAGRVIRRQVTIPEGLDIFRTAEILAAGGWVDRDRFLLLTRDSALIRQLGLKVDTLEGYLFPDTYSLSREQEDEVAIIRMMVGRMLAVFREVQQKAGQETELSRHEILTLASIVEKETGQDAERPLVAGVFLNRLARKMPLQADPTVIYGLRNFDGNLTRRDLETLSPYNTYMNRGLPPGPIANPGRAAIAAVFSPSKEAYLYFVAKQQDGAHHFSKTLAEHNRAVARYQKRAGR